MSNAASKLKPMDLRLKDEFLIHLIFASLPKEYETFVVNYNMQPDKWDIQKLIAMCVQEDERLKSSQGDSINLVKDNKKKNFKKNAKPQGKAPQNNHHQKNNNARVEKDQCKWCKKHEYYQRDCLDFLKSLLKRDEDFITFIDKFLFLSYAKSTWWIDSGATVHVSNSLQGFHTRRTPQRGEKELKLQMELKLKLKPLEISLQNQMIVLYFSFQMSFMYPLCIEI